MHPNGQLVCTELQEACLSQTIWCAAERNISNSSKFMLCLEVATLLFDVTAATTWNLVGPNSFHQWRDSMSRDTLKKHCWLGLKASRTKLEWLGVRVVRREKKRQGILKVNQLAKWRALIPETSTCRTLWSHSLAHWLGMCLYSVDNILLCVRDDFKNRRQLSHAAFIRWSAV